MYKKQIIKKNMKESHLHFLNIIDNFSEGNSGNKVNEIKEEEEEEINEEIKEEEEKEEIKEEKIKEEISKDVIDSIIENVNSVFLQHKLNYINDSNNEIKRENNPNLYLDINICKKYLSDPSKNKFYKHKYIHKNKKIQEENNILKTHIVIEHEVNTINDLLILIETYKLEPNIEYNINMKALHNIKEPLTELNNMIGIKELKNNIVDQIIYFIQEFNKNMPGDFMHTVIYGPPGTGKTEIAKIIGKIYSKIGILKKGTFKKATRNDLIAGYLGQTAMKTSEVIKECLGGVLFIDEAYALGNYEKSDSFSKECIDTLCEALSDNKDNLMVIIAGYEEELEECFFKYNQGLDSRFTWRFKTDQYNGEDLYHIFVKKVKDIGWSIHEDINIKWFKENVDYFKFFGRDIEILLAKTKIAHSKRVFCKSDHEKKKITIGDLEKGLETYLKNNNAKNKKENEYFKKSLQNTIYV